jgi:agmatine deiminase
VHRAVWLAWPTLADEWRGDLDAPRRSVAELCRAIADVDPVTGTARGESIEMLVVDDEAESTARANLDAPAQFHRIPYGDIWMRDTAPVFTTDADGNVSAVSFAFNGWGGEYLFEHDPEVAERVARAAGVELTVYPEVVEGGAIDVDGSGHLLTTRQCLLDPNRNPSRSEGDMEGRLREAFGVERITWLDRGLLNDHTDGHIDTIARFVAPGVAACMVASDHDDPNREVLSDIRATLVGAGLDVVDVPSPGRVDGPDGAPMPASYLNFYIANTSVVVPTYRSPHDEAAVAAIGELFPGRRTVALDGLSVLTGGGAFHCITMDQP